MRLTLHEQSTAFSDLAGAAGVHAFGRTTISALDIADGWATFTVPVKALQKRGLMELVG